MQLLSTYMKKGIKNIASASMLLKSSQIQAIKSFHHKANTSPSFSVKNIAITDEKGNETVQTVISKRKVYVLE